MSSVTCRQCGTSVSSGGISKGEFECPDCGWRELMPNALSRKSGARSERANGAATTDGATATLERSESASEDCPMDDVATTSETTSETASEDDWQAPAMADISDIRALSRDEFTEWCVRWFGRFGFAVETGGGDDGDCDLQLMRGGAITFVDCVCRPENELVDRATVQRFVGALVGARVKRGIIMTPGACSDSCRAFIRDIADEYDIDLVDGDRLAEMVHATIEGPLATWFR